MTTPAPIIEPGWLSREGAVAWSGLPLRTVAQAIAEEKVKTRRIGRKVLIERESLNQWIESEEPLEWARKNSAGGSPRQTFTIA